MLPLLHIRDGDLPRQVAHASEERGALGDADGAARIQQVEGVRTAQDIVVRRDHQLVRQTALGLRLEQIVHQLEAADIGDLEIVFAVLDLGLLQHVAIRAAAIPVDLPDLVHALQVHHDAFQTVGVLDGDRVEREAARLLEVGILADLHPVEPDLPAQPPRAERGRLPVVLHETDIVLVPVDADGRQAVQIQLLGIGRRRLQDHLKLGVHLHAVGILGVAAIVGAIARLGVGDIPRLRPQHAEHRGRIARARADLLAVWLPDQAALRGPVALEPHDDFLE